MGFLSKVVILMTCIVNLVSAAADTPKPYPYDPEANEKLLVDLLRNYHKGVPPTHEGPVQVSMSFSMMYFDFIDEANEIATVHAWHKLAWTDNRLKWDEEDYNHTSMIRIDMDDIWTPDIELYNSAKVTKTIEQQALLHSKGDLLTVPSYQIEFVCPMNLQFFPYDEQVCRLKYGSWHNHADILNLTLMGDGIDRVNQIPTRDFEVTETTAKRHEITYQCCDETYMDVTFTIRLKRSSSIYSTKLVLPSVLTGFLVLLTFLLPPASYEKITLCGIVFICLLLLLIYLHLIIPSAGDTILGEYLAFALFIDFFATVMAVISYHINTRSLKQTQSQTEMGTAGDDNDVKLHMPKDRKKTWLRHLDIVSFILFSIVFIVGLAIILGRRA